MSFEDFEERETWRVSMEFEEYCENFCIKKQLTIGKTSQQNGLAERKNRI